MSNAVQLEPEAQKFAEETAQPPFLFDLPPEKGRETVDEVQSSPVSKPPADLVDFIVPAGPKGSTSVRIVKPKEVSGKLPVIVYVHGGGWVFGNAHTHDRLIRELAVSVPAIVVFPNYSLSPEAKYPTALNECYAVTRWVAENAEELGADPERLIVAGDSAGGNLAIGVTLLAKQRQSPTITQQLLFYPVTNADFETGSYEEFAKNFFLRRDGMEWFWDQYTNHPDERSEITVSPLRASREELEGLPPALVITAEADVLRDEGEAYANKLRAAGVPVTAARFQGIIHDFVMLNALAETKATRGAMALAISWLKAGG